MYSFQLFCRPQLHLDQQLLAAKLKQLRSLMQLYESEVQWLSCSSRLWFGQLKGQKVAVLIDTSDSACTKEDYLHYIMALQLLVMEQLSSMSEVHMMSIGSEIHFTEPKVLNLQNNPRYNLDILIQLGLIVHGYRCTCLKI